MEEWAAVPGYSRYSVSEEGRVRSEVAWRGQGQHYLLGKTNTSGYRQTRMIGDDGTVRQLMVAVLVCELFVGPKPTPLHEVNHKDGKKLNNAATNLEWVTPHQNVEHGWRLGLQRGRTRVTADQMREIEASPESTRQLAARLGLGKSTVWAVRAGKRKWGRATTSTVSPP